MRLSRIVLYFLIGVFAAHCTFYYPNLPPEMASHFDASGNPNGYLSKDSFFIFEGVILLLIVLEFTLLPWMIGKMPEHLINMPNKDYWFAAERRAGTLGIITRYFEWFSASLLALFTGINHLVFRANLNNESLSWTSWLIIGAFLIFVIVWLIKFVRRFRIENI